MQNDGVASTGPVMRVVVCCGPVTVAPVPPSAGRRRWDVTCPRAAHENTQRELDAMLTPWYDAISRVESSRVEPAHSVGLPQPSERPLPLLPSCFSPLPGRATDARGVIRATRSRHRPPESACRRRPLSARPRPARGGASRTLSHPLLTVSTSRGALRLTSGHAAP